MNQSDKLNQIVKYLVDTRRKLDEALDEDSEYNTSTGNGVNSHEANAMFEEVEKELRKILDK